MADRRRRQRQLLGGVVYVGESDSLPESLKGVGGSVGVGHLGIYRLEVTAMDVDDYAFDLVGGFYNAMAEV